MSSILMMALMTLAYASSETHWKSLSARLDESSIDWISNSFTNWRFSNDLVFDSNTNWKESIDKEYIYHIDKEFMVVAASLDCLTNDGTWCTPGRDDTVLVTVGIGYLFNDSDGYSLPGRLIKGKALVSSVDAVTEYKDGTVDVMMEMVDGSLGVLTVTSSQIDKSWVYGL